MDENNLGKSVDSGSDIDIDNEGIDGKYLTFLTDGQLFGVPISLVLQIVGVQSITPVPEFPEYAKGFINLRGVITPVIDVRLRFDMEERAYDEKTCIIVANLDEKQIGFIVDEVDAVTDISDESISPPPLVKNRSAKNYLTGVAQLTDRVALLLDINKLLSEEVVAALSPESIHIAE